MVSITLSLSLSPLSLHSFGPTTFIVCLSWPLPRPVVLLTFNQKNIDKDNIKIRTVFVSMPITSQWLNISSNRNLK